MSIDFGDYDIAGFDTAFIYFLQIEKTGPIKIGESDDIDKRFRQIASTIPMRVYCLGVIKRRGISNLERALQFYFIDLCIRGEWFKPDKRIFDFVKLHCEPFNLSEYRGKKTTNRYGRFVPYPSNSVLQDIYEQGHPKNP